MENTALSQHISSFQILKPLCTQVANFALHEHIKAANRGQLSKTLQDLYNALSLVGIETDICNTKIAEYVFFPLSHLFRQAVSLPSEVLELALRCLEVLLPGTWCRDVESEIHHQLLILLTFLIAGNRSVRSTYQPNEGVTLAALRCLGRLFEPCTSKLYFNPVEVSKRRLLVLGHVTTVILDAISHLSSEISSVASETMTMAIRSIQSQEILRRFTPGIISTISKSLQPCTWSRKSSHSIMSALSVLDSLLPIVLVPDSKYELPHSDTIEEHGQQTSGDDWLDSSLPQIQNALSCVLRIKRLDKDTVTESLFRVCSEILRVCNKTLGSLTVTILETLLEVASLGSEETRQERISHLADLLAVQSQISPLLKDILYRWIMAVSRLVTSHDHIASRRHMGKIATCYETGRLAAIDLKVLDIDLIPHILNSVTAILDTDSSGPMPLLLNETLEAISSNEQQIHPQITRSILELPLCGIGSHETLVILGGFVKYIFAQNPSRMMQSHLLKSLGVVDSKARLAHLWLSSRIMDSALQLLEQKGPKEETKEHLDFCNALYSTAVEILRRSSIDIDLDWRNQAMALQIVAMFASWQGPRFQSELDESLYPIVESAASSNSRLREFAWLCIQDVTQACGYKSTKELLVENIDYLISSMALKLNISTISLEAPKVLVMVVRLCGDTVTPFLDDIIESVYSNLEMYHGYPYLVEALFSFLVSVVSVKLKTEREHPAWERHQIIKDSDTDGTSMMKLGRLLETKSQPDYETGHLQDSSYQPHMKNHGNREAPSTHKNQESRIMACEMSTTISTSKAIIQTIVSLGQHYLTHDSPSLRCEVLKLTGYSCSILYTDEDRFLPLVNDLWPVVVRRLYDPEATVCMAACTTISEFYNHARGFMRSRVEDEWSGISRLYRQNIELLKQKEKKGKDSRSTSTYRTWDALFRMFCSLIENVEVGGELEDDLIEMLEPYYSFRDDACRALDILNQDAVWLRKELNNKISETDEQPSVKEYKFTGVLP